MVKLPAFAEPVQLSSFVELVARTLNINVTVQGDVPGSVVFNAPLPVKKSELIPLLNTLLEQQGYNITKGEFGFYTIQPMAGTPPLVNVGEDSTTRVFRTPNIRPSSLKTAIDSQMGASLTGRQAAYMDELGLILATDSPRRIAQMGELVQRLLLEAGKTTFTRLELRYLSANVARDRAIQLVGSGTPGRTGGVTPAAGQEAVAAPVARAGAIDNLADRLTIDPQGNALIFRGLTDEVEQVRSVLNVIDVPNNLEPETFFVGSAAAQIANIARQRGLGEVTTISTGDTGTGQQGAFNTSTYYQAQQQVAAQQPGGSTTLTGGPVMVIDESRGIIIYYGTSSQRDQLRALVKQLDPQSEKVIIGVYKLKNSDAEQVAQVIQNLLSNSQPTGTSSLLPGGGTQAGSRYQRNQRNQPATQNQPAGTPPRTSGATSRSGTGDLTLESNGFVIADKANNQILVKAPVGQQPEFRKLIDKLDLRRPQVFIEAKIIVVNWDDKMRLAFETQLINAGGTGGALNTNFGLGTFASGAAITAVKTVTPLAGLSAAVIKSDQVPIIVNALQTKTDARILSTPQILVNDNEDAEIISVDSEPTATTTQVTGVPSQTSFGGYEDAGTTLQVTPSISEGGYIRLKYSIELSSFTGPATSTATESLPPPKQKNNLDAGNITIPSDTTVIVGGLNFDSRSLTKSQIPLLGDIPLIGLLFQDRNTENRTTSLYVFLTPHVLRDPTFADLTLLTAGPQTAMHLGHELPPLRTAPIDINTSPAPARMPLEQPVPTIPLPAPAPAPTPTPAPAPAPIPLPPPSASAPPPEPFHETKSPDSQPKSGHSNDDTR
jgi:general secretion pathway protein D